MDDVPTPYVLVVDTLAQKVVAKFWFADGKLQCDNEQYLSYVLGDDSMVYSPKSPAILDEIPIRYKNGYLNAYKVT